MAEALANLAEKSLVDFINNLRNAKVPATSAITPIG
jgi:hypothetical protein